MIKLFRIYLIKKSKMLEIPVSAMHLFLYLNNILKVMRTTPFSPPLPFAERAAVSFGNVLQAARQSQKRIPPLSAGANPRRAGPVTAPIERHSVWLCNSGGTVEHLPLHPVVL